MNAARPRHVGLALALFVFGFLVSAAFVQERIREREQPLRERELEELIAGRREAIDALAHDVGALSRRVDRVRKRAGRRSTLVRDLAVQAERLAGIAGLERIRGPGIVVELSDSEDVPRTRAEQTDLRIQDTDLQLVVNALWRAGTEAMAVNGNRLISTSAIRAAGSAVLVNYRGVASPYRIVALGDPVVLEQRLEGSLIARQFGVWKDVYGLGFSIDPATRVVVPPLAGFSELRWARPQ